MTLCNINAHTAKKSNGVFLIPWDEHVFNGTNYYNEVSDQELQNECDHFCTFCFSILIRTVWLLNF